MDLTSSCQDEEKLTEEEQKIKQEQDALTLDMEKLWGFVEKAQKAYQKVVDGMLHVFCLVKWASLHPIRTKHLRLNTKSLGLTARA